MKSHARSLAFAAAVAAMVTMEWIPRLAATAHAHDPGLSSSVVTLRRDEVTAELRIHAADLADARDVAAGEVLVLKSGHETIRAVRAEQKIDADGEPAYSLVFAVPQEAVLEVEVPLLVRLARGHKHHLEVRTEAGTMVASAILGAANPRMAVAPPGTAAAGEAFSRRGSDAAHRTDPVRADVALWFTVGLGHILEGYDHLLFVFALLLGAATFGASVRLITAFTVGHSISLALAATGLVAVSAAIVEPAIAASIVAVALLSLGGRNGGRESLVLTFAFGLLHGLGFASALAESGIATGSTARLLGSVLCFNLGVEAGQLAFAAVALPLLTLLRRRPLFAAQGARWCSAAVAACGLVWFVERVAAG